MIDSSKNSILFYICIIIYIQIIFIIGRNGKSTAIKKRATLKGFLDMLSGLSFHVIQNINIPHILCLNNNTNINIFSFTDRSIYMILAVIHSTNMLKMMTKKKKRIRKNWENENTFPFSEGMLFTCTYAFD